jgi:hypothetical protein
MDHVKQLVQAIRQNGGLTDPLLVRDSDKVVLEGNSRLAAYRYLARANPVQWGFVKCDVVLADINDFDVTTLLTHYHIVGRKSWDPYEQAGMFWRWHQEGAGLDVISQRVEEIGVSGKKIQHWIRVYSMMVEQKDNEPSRWSYYDEFVKSRYIRHACEAYPELPKVFARKIHTGELDKAVDVRNKVAKIAKAGGQPLRAFVRNERPLDSCYERAVARGAANVLYNQLKRFRVVICDPDTKADVRLMKDSLRKKSAYELRRIKSAAERLLEMIKES